jgi:hypothetical protein
MRETVSKRKLSLNKTTLRVLTGDQLRRIAGAYVESASVIAEDCHPVGTTIPVPSQDVPCGEPPPPPPPTRTWVTITTHVTVSRVG